MTRIDPRDMRVSYADGELTDEALGADPMELFDAWMALAAADDRVAEPNAMVLATVGDDGAPTARTVLLKSYGPDGFTFYTNYESAKGAAIEHDKRVALVFPWHPMSRQVRVEGRATKVPREETQAYFTVRPRESQVGAWASWQSEPIGSRAELDEQYAAAEARFEGGDVPVPEHWGGYLVVPRRLEFWQGRKGRLHDRLEFAVDRAGSWRPRRLQP